ncbi:hypothetical protein [Campylobacter sp. US33a]|uniref:hypothetical protein n=1 Tax=Campylobacter sp. US33a TaxID=2498120 RepID=UPI001068D319|nr:hypothetical protein [Campylobacter sp. US33a]TEY00707.1 hypothetical protein ELQ16_08720 [Campylobacter sp. US33a]
MENTIEVKQHHFDANTLHMNTSSKLPVIGLLSEYWTGDEDSFTKYLLDNQILPSETTINNVEELLDFSNKIFANLIKMGQQGKIEKFDFKLASLFKPRFLRDFEQKEFQVLLFDISGFDNEEIKNKIKDIFLSVKSKSFIEFKEICEDKMFLTISRRGIAETKDNDDDSIAKLSIATARDRITLLNNFQSAKDNNYISSDFILKMATMMQESDLSGIKFNVRMTVGYNEYDATYTAEEVIAESLKTKQEREALQKVEEIKQQAREEIKQQDNLNRISLSPDSNMEQIQKAQTQIRMSKELVNEIKINPQPLNIGDEYVMGLFDDYCKKEIEKKNILLERAKEQGKNAYQTLKSHIEAGLPILEALNRIKEQYRQDETVMFASLLLTKDIVNVANKDIKITDLSVKNTELEKEIEKFSLDLVKKEENITNLQSALTKKSNEMNLLKEHYNEIIYKMKQELEENIKSLETDFNSKINEANDIIDEQSKIIDRLTPYEDQVVRKDERIKELESKYERILEEKLSLEGDKKASIAMMKAMEDKVQKNEMKSKELESKYERILEEKLSLEGDKLANITELVHLKDENQLLKNKVKNLKEEGVRVKELEMQEKFLRDKIANLENQIKETNYLMQKIVANTKDDELKSPVDILGHKLK